MDTDPDSLDCVPGTDAASGFALGDEVRVAASDERSQARNRTIALERLRSLGSPPRWNANPDGTDTATSGWFQRANLISNPSAFVLGMPGLGKSTFVRRQALGLAGFCFYQWRKFGDPFTFITVQSAWDQESGPRTWLKVRFFEDLTTLDDRNILGSLSYLAHPVLTFAALALVPRVFRRFGYGYGTYALLAVLVPALATKNFFGMARYLLAAFPIFAVAGELLAERPKLARWWDTMSARPSTIFSRTDPESSRVEVPENVIFVVDNIRTGWTDLHAALETDYLSGINRWEHLALLHRHVSTERLDEALSVSRDGGTH